MDSRRTGGEESKENPVDDTQAQEPTSEWEKRARHVKLTWLGYIPPGSDLSPNEWQITIVPRRPPEDRSEGTT